MPSAPLILSKGLDEIIHRSKNLHGKNISVLLLAWNLHQLLYYSSDTASMLIPESLLQVADECPAPFFRVGPHDIFQLAYKRFAS